MAMLTEVRSGRQRGSAGDVKVPAAKLMRGRSRASTRTGDNGQNGGKTTRTADKMAGTDKMAIEETEEASVTRLQTPKP